MSKTVKIDDLADEVMKGLTEYSNLATADMKKAVRKAGNDVRKEIQDTAPKKTGAYAKSWKRRVLMRKAGRSRKQRNLPKNWKLLYTQRTAISWHTFLNLVMPSVAAAEPKHSHTLHLPKNTASRHLKKPSKKH